MKNRYISCWMKRTNSDSEGISSDDRNGMWRHCKAVCEWRKIILSKVDIVEMGSQDPETMEAYVNAAVKQLNPAKQVALAARILKFAQQET